MKIMRFVVLFVIVALWPAALPVSAGRGGKTTVVAQDFTLGAGERLHDDLVALGGRVRLERESTVEGDVVLVGSEAEIAGQVEGDVVAFGSSVELAATAVVEGDVVVFGRLRRDPRADVRGSLVEGLEASESLRNMAGMFSGRPRIVPGRPVPVRPRVGAPEWLVDVVRAVSTILAMLLVAMLVVTVLPENLDHITSVMVNSALVSLGTGVLTVALVVVLVPLLTFICIGIPVAIVILIAVTLSALVGWVSTGCLVGRKLFEMLNVSRQSPLVEILGGTLLITLLSTIPCVGVLLATLLLSWSLGAVVLTRFGTAPSPLWSPFSPGAVTPPDPGAASGHDPRDRGGVSTDRRGDTRKLDESALLDCEPDA